MRGTPLARCAVRIALAAAVAASVPAEAKRIVVMPGAGTPLQDAIEAAEPGDALVLSSGAYPEAVVVDRALRLTTASAASVTVGPAVDAPVTLRIAADDVSLRAGKGAHVTVVGGGPVILIEHARGVRLRDITADGGVEGLEVRDATRVTIRDCAMSGSSTGVHLAAIAPHARVVVNGGFAFGSVSGAFLEAIAPGATLGRSGVVVKRAFVTGGCGGVSIRLVDADGVAIRRNRIAGSIGCIQSVDLDSASDRNLITQNEIGPFPVDAGSGNCWRNNVGVALPTTCP